MRLRRSLADQLTESRDLRSPLWRRSVETVPREAFLPDDVFRDVDGQWEPVSRAQMGDEAWLRLVYEDRTIVTQRNDFGEPTSSSTLPGLVVRMLEYLDLREGDKVLEIGTGTGYSTALMCRRLGPELVTSIEIDPDVAERAAAAVRGLGHEPELITGDGLQGHPGGAPYDRIIATCAVRHIPRAWLRQSRTGATILATLSGWQHGFGLVKMTVDGPGSAHGTFLPGHVSFMMARPHQAPPSDVRLPGRAGTPRAASLDPNDIWEDWTATWVAQLATPDTHHTLVLADDGPAEHLLTDHVSQSWAWISANGEGWVVRQNGPQRLWDAIEEAIHLWDGAGRPHQSAFGITITPGAQRVWLGTPDGPSWNLPTCAD
ncbi:methyltransferase domain-containing protein [Nonomuraea mesophila]|uniref:Protein-L-isoaspartate O-methyltransferase n=2 Tax=Nonomuraea mesophila TaxID=2530382 RepID=A0A4V2Z8R7_9ACTN|nr:methyltransferase domain-containing protein [Nonomuraea mesophila]